MARSTPQQGSWWNWGVVCLLMWALFGQASFVLAGELEPLVHPVWRSPAFERAVVNVPGSDLSVLPSAAVLEATLPTAACTSRLHTSPWRLELVSGDRLTIEVLGWTPTRLEYRWQTGARGTCPRGAIDRLIRLEPAGSTGTAWLPCQLPVGREELALTKPDGAPGDSLWIVGRQGQIWPVTSLDWQPTAVHYTLGSERAQVPHSALAAVITELQPAASPQVAGWQVEVQLQPGWLSVALIEIDKNLSRSTAHTGEGPLDVLRGCLVDDHPTQPSPEIDSTQRVWIDHPWLGRLGLPWKWIRRLRLFAPGTQQSIVITAEVSTNSSPSTQPWLFGVPATVGSAPEFEWPGPWLTPRLIPLDGRLQTGEPPLTPLANGALLCGWSVNGHSFGPGQQSVSRLSLSEPVPVEWPFRALSPEVLIPVAHLQPGRNVLRRTVTPNSSKRSIQNGLTRPIATTSVYRLEQSLTLAGSLSRWLQQMASPPETSRLETR